MSPASHAADPDCLACRHFFVTWEAAHPRGCRVFGIRCRELPSAAVRRSSGEPCAAFEAREGRAPHQGTGAPE